MAAALASLRFRMGAGQRTPTLHSSFIPNMRIAAVAVTLTTLLAVNAELVHLHKRIVDGDAAPNKLPWLVSIQDDKRNHFCGGSLVSVDIVLSGKLHHACAYTNNYCSCALLF